jgi:hypothetical protein
MRCNMILRLSLCSCVCLSTAHLSAQDLPPAAEVVPEQPVAEPGYLGVVTDDRAQQGRGVRIVQLLPEGPAAKAGLRTDDLIVAVERTAIASNADLAAVFRTTAAGDVREIIVERGGERFAYRVRFGQRPPPGERLFRSFGQIPSAGDPAGGEEFLPQDSELPEGPPLRLRGDEPAGGAPLANPGVERLLEAPVEDRLSALERRMSDLERRLSEIERLLRRE